MAIEQDIKVDSGDNGYNGQLHVLVGAQSLVGGAVDVPMPAGITGGRVTCSYHPTGFNPANAGFLTARLNPATPAIELRSSNVADGNLVVFHAFVSP